MTATDAVTCACGSNMNDNGWGVFYCENCDYPQPQQYMAMERRKTKEDIRFEMFWVRQEEEYKDNTVEDVGNPNKEGESNE